MRVSLLVAALISTPLVRAAEPDASVFGAAVSQTETTPLAAALAKPEDFSGKTIAVEAEIVKSCSKKGCWMILKDGPDEIRVTFKDYGFFVPKGLRNRRARVQGAVARQTLSVSEARHYLKDEGAPKSEIKKITKPVETVSFTATGVSLLPAAPAAERR